MALHYVKIIKLCYLYGIVTLTVMLIELDTLMQLCYMNGIMLRESLVLMELHYVTLAELSYIDKIALC